ncbi:MAG: O-antigen ligase family protein [Sphingobacteriaceae bacterium]|nr:O-antigen ligase family protein [Sphingobacteriaceae bacterium]
MLGSISNGSSIFLLAFRYISSFLVLGVLTTAVLGFSFAGDVFINASKQNYFMFFMGLLFICISCYIALITIQDRSLRVTVSNVDLMLLIWLAYIVINSFVLNPIAFSYDKLLVFSLTIGYYFIIRLLLDNNRMLLKCVFFYGLMSLSIFESIVGWLQISKSLTTLNEFFPLTGTFRNPAPFAMFLAVCYSISLSSIFIERQKVFRIPSVINLILILSILPLTDNRSSWVSVFIITVIALGYNFRTFINNRWCSITKSFKLTLISVIICLIAKLLTSLYKYKSVSADSRLLIWEVSLRKASNVFFGEGYGSFRSCYNKWQIDYFRMNGSQLHKQYFSNKTSIADFAGYIKTAYNEYLEIFVEQGLIGLNIFFIVLLIIIFKVVLTVKKKYNPCILIYSLGLISLLILSFFSYPFNSLPTFILLFMFLAFIVDECNGVHIGSKLSKINYISCVCICVILVSIGSVVCYKSISRFQAYNQYQKANVYFREDKVSAEIIYTKVFNQLKNEPVFLIDFSKCLIENNKLEKALRCLLLAERLDNDPRIYMLKGNILKIQKSYSDAEEAYREASLIIPSRMYPKYLLVKLYQETNQLAEAIAMANEILQLKAKASDEISKRIKLEMKMFLIQINTQ